MKNKIILVCSMYAIFLSLAACTKKASSQPGPPSPDSGLVNTLHLDYLYTPVKFSTGTNAAGIYIYSEAPDYHLVAATGEGFACVDDVSRAALVYLRSNKISSDTAIQSKLYNLISFILEMQSSNGYFYNFLFANSLINTGGPTSINNPNWWSWRALQTLTEAEPFIKTKDLQLYNKMEIAINKLIVQIKIEMVGLPLTTKAVNGIIVPQWLPAGSGTDQSATLILGLIPYCVTTNDSVIGSYIRNLADGISLMQVGDSTHFPYACFLSWENTWHAYGNAQAYALMKASVFLNDPQYSIRATAEVDNFYPWLSQNGFKSSLTLSNVGGIYQTITDNTYDQIAYGIEPMVFAATELYNRTGKAKYADLAGKLAAWLLGANNASTNIYDKVTGRCYDAISSGPSVNLNSGAESTIEALLILESVEHYPEIKAALNRYKKA
jgi:hypothetical protein